jgi:1,2-diacylglycerol 3-alpha-glucosyltransferase
MNIALMLDAFTPMKNGVITSALQLKEGLEKRGHHVVVATVEVKGYKEKEKNIYRVPTFVLGLGDKQDYGIGLVNRKKLLNFLKENKVELIHTHTEFALGFSGKAAAKKLHIPHIHTTHTMWEEYRHYIFHGWLLSSKMVKRIMRFFLKGVSTIVAPSVKAKKYDQMVIPEVPVQIVPNGIDMKKFKSSSFTEGDITKLRNQYGIQKSDKLLVFVGRMGQEKRVQELFNSVVPIAKENPDVKLILVGDGPDLTKLKDNAKAVGLESTFIFTGFVNWDKVYQLYSIADIFVTSSLSEVHPMTLIEGAMCGLPLIARRDDSYLDLVYPGKNGYLVDTDEEMTEKIKLLLNDNALLKQFSKASLEISQMFTADHHVERMEKLYKRVLELYPDRLDQLKKETIE